MTPYAEKVVSIARAFGIDGTFGIYEITNGKINHTLRLDFLSPSGERKSYVAQEVNTYVYRKPEEVMANIERVTTHIKAKGSVRTLDFLKDREGKTFHYDGASFWRIFSYIDSVTYNASNDLTVVRNAGKAYGAFQKSLSDFDAASLYHTIPDFHNTTKRFETLKTAVRENPLGRLASCEREVAFVLGHEADALVLDILHKKGELPLRVTHNDTKINNVLFDKVTHEALCVVDLDTVMPGFAGHDFGDSIRSCANTMGSGSLDFGKVKVNLEVLSHYAEGFLLETAGNLTEAEIETFAESALVMTLELSSRYLLDYLTGDRYFSAKYQEQNLDRARNQIALASDMISKMDQMKSIIASYQK